MDFRWIVILLHLMSDTGNVAPSAESYTSVVDSVAAEWSEIRFDTKEVINKMAYADTANFMHQKIYPCARCFLRPEAANAFEKAILIAAEKNLKLIVFDCYRPYRYQQTMYDIVKNPRYVAKPGKGSNHNRGLAIDVALADEEGNTLDMGNSFDDFSEKSHFIAKQITTKAANNRIVLRSIMTEAGFIPYDNEWWHFDFKSVKYPVADFVWNCN